MVINSPDGRGISHNVFSDYNAGKKGLVIHNKENAETIINEVIGENKSRLRGNTFVTGGKTLPVIINTAQNNDVIFDARKPLHASERLTDIRHNISVNSPRCPLLYRHFHGGISFIRNFPRHRLSYL